MRLGKATVPGLALLGFAFFCSAPSCKAQEVNPDHFTETGIEPFSEHALTVVKNGVQDTQVAQKGAPAAQVKEASLTQAVAKPRKSSKVSVKKANPASGK